MGEHGRLLARHSGKQTLMKRLRPYLSDVAAAVGISTRIVPHQLRHTYASEMVRARVSLPALMTLLGHVKAEMTMKYVLVAGDDLQREFHLARSQPRHLAPQPKAPIISPRAGLEGVVDSLLFAQHAIEWHGDCECQSQHNDSLRYDRLCQYGYTDAVCSPFSLVVSRIMNCLRLQEQFIAPSLILPFLTSPILP